jgi:hypothetical protein
MRPLMDPRANRLARTGFVDRLLTIGRGVSMEISVRPMGPGAA